jgi:phage anti-repressor protein
MNNLQIFNKDIIPVYTTDEGNKVVMGRELHEKLGIKDKYTDWMQRMIGAGFIEGSDYFTLREKPKRKDGTEMPGERINHIMTLDMAKHIAMIQRTPQGMAIRQKLIELEKSFSVPQIQVGNSLQALNLLVQSLNEQQDAMNRLQVNVDAQSAAIEKLEEQNELNRQAFTMNPGNWRENATAVVGSIVRKKTGGEMKGSGPVYEEVWNEIYGMMKSEFHKDMKRRKMNLEKEFPKRKFSNLEVIDRAGDRNQLISILQSVLCKMCIRYGVRLDMDRAKIVASKPDDAQTSLFERGA